MSVAREKKELRLTAKAQRRGQAQAAVAAGAAEKLADNFSQAGLDTPLNPSGAIAGYWPMSDEIDVRPLMARLFDAGQTVALPVVVAPEAPLIFRRWQPDMALDAGGFGTFHPPGDPLGINEPEIIPDLLLIPLLAFDTQGFRLGWGGGFYDRTLAGLRAASPVIAVGVAYYGQQIDAVPHTPEDEVLDWIITDEDVLEIR